MRKGRLSQVSLANFLPYRLVYAIQASVGQTGVVAAYFEVAQRAFSDSISCTLSSFRANFTQ